VVARLDVFSPETDDSPFMRNLLRRGTVRPYFNGSFHPGGLDVDPAHHPLSHAGRAAARLWAVGYLTEGAYYYTHALPRPQLPSRQVLEADRCVAELFAALASDRGGHRTRPSAPEVAPGETIFPSLLGG
jgi:uncharacterized NAD(P)/FAD-binding protein YdhS